MRAFVQYSHVLTLAVPVPRPQPNLFAQEQAQARETERQAEREQMDQQVKTAKGRKADAAREKAAIMAYVNSLSPEEREALEQGFREHLSHAKLAPFIAKKFEGGLSWYSDPIIKAEALNYLKAVRSDFALSEREFAII